MIKINYNLKKGQIPRSQKSNYKLNCKPFVLPLLIFNLCCVSCDSKENSFSNSKINVKNSAACSEELYTNKTLSKESLEISDLSKSELHSIYVKNLDVNWTPINTDGVDSYNSQTMQGITKNRSSIILRKKIPHSASDVYNLVKDYNAKANVNSDQSNVFQTALDNISGYDGKGKKGGILIIPKGTYHLKDINFRSNIMILCQPGVIFTPYIPSGYNKKITIFSLGDKNNDKVENVGLRGILGSRVKINIPIWEKGITSFNVDKVEHFIFSNINFYDNKTVYCCFGFGPGDPKNHKDFPRPTDGYIGYANAYNCHFGYGLMQIQSARMLHVEHLYSQGGVCYRLETGWNLMNQYSTLGEGGIFDITGYDINSENGACAVMMSPHSQQCEGTVCIEKVNARSCEFGILLSAGFVSKVSVANSKKKEYIKGFDSSGNQTVALTPGHFNSQSFIRDIDVTFGTNAQCRYYPEIKKYMPDEYLSKINIFDKNGKTLKFIENVAAIAPINVSSTSAAAPFENYGYSIDWSKTNFSIHGFKYNNGNTIKSMNPKILR